MYNNIQYYIDWAIVFMYLGTHKNRQMYKQLRKRGHGFERKQGGMHGRAWCEKRKGEILESYCQKSFKNKKNH